MKYARSNRLFRCANVAVSATIVAATSTLVSAQDDAESVARLEKVEVTGSRIPRTDIETALPVQVITREDIDRSGSTTVAEMMAKVSASILGDNDRLSAAGNNAPGLSSVNLRGIGSSSTLVLLNGRRLANYAFDGGAVDVNSIPLSAIERVEILKDGASAIYGADAIAGVVNFILRKDFQGLEATAYGGWTEHGGGNQYQANVTAGHGDLAKDRFNVFATFSYQKDQGLANTARPYTRTGYLPDEGVISLDAQTLPANILFPPLTGDLYNPVYARGCAPPTSLPFRGFPACGFDSAPFRYSIPPVERLGVFGRGAIQPSADHLLFAELGYMHNAMTLQFAPTPKSEFSTSDGSRIVYPEGGPYYPTAFAAANGISGDLDLLYRSVPLGPRIDDVTTSAWRAVVGAEGIVDGWSYNAALTYSRNDQTETYASGFVSTSRLIEAMATGLINPFGPSGPEGDALLAATQVSGDAHWARGTALQLEAGASREVYALPGGPLAVALGGEVRRERLDNQFAPFLASGDVDVVGTQPVSASRNVGSLYFESVVPVVKTVEAQLAVRYDHYSDFGGTTNPKVALRWQPLSTLLLRTSWGTGFRAPTLYDLYTPQQMTTDFLQNGDPVRCPVTESAYDCGSLFPALTGGNPNLQPETSEQFNAGAVWEPAKGLSLAADYWKINKNNYVGMLSANTIDENFAYYEPTNIRRGDPLESDPPGLPGPIKAILLLNQNLGQLRTSGIDIDVNWRGPVMPFGRLSAALNGTYIINWKLQPDGLTYVWGVGNEIFGPIPRWRHYASFNWDYGPWGATLAQTYQSGHSDANDFKKDSPFLPRRVSSYDIWDLQGRYGGFSNATLVLGIKNLMDRAPPFTNGTSTGWAPIYADPRGRMFYARLTYAFK